MIIIEDFNIFFIVMLILAILIFMLKKMNLLVYMVKVDVVKRLYLKHYLV